MYRTSLYSNTLNDSFIIRSIKMKNSEIEKFFKNIENLNLSKLVFVNINIEI